ncbi:MAG: sulfatase-like hydrolase/transferase [Luteitalea sp.]|nr:sulfatase-like hydrolase/transferase [Luteitalea sp.]
MSSQRAVRRVLCQCLALTMLAMIGASRSPLVASTPLAQDAGPSKRPNILLAIADDWSWPHASAYDDKAVSTPVFDRVAREGVLFGNAFVAAPSCTPSRAAILTGQYPHRLAEGSNLHGFLPSRFPVYPDLLEEADYYVGYTRKGWGPGRFEPGGRTRNPAGEQFKDFDSFLTSKPSNQPFVFWFGSQDPHRPYEEGSDTDAGIGLDRVEVPPHLPDTREVRSDLADYYAEVQRFDREVGEILKRLDAAGELDNTLVVITSDNGMPFPRAKANLYDAGAHVPLAVRWPGKVTAGATIDGFVSLVDLAPTFLEVAGLEPPDQMTGRSLLTLAADEQDVDRDHVFIERERHAQVRKGDLSYPMRAVRTRDWLYIRNLRPDRWPAGDPEMYFSVGPFGDIDGGPTKQALLDGRDDATLSRFFHLATDKRPAEELYDLRADPGQLRNLADDQTQAKSKAELRRLLDEWMRETGDPRATNDDDRWDRYPYYGGRAKTEPVKGE